MTFSPLLAWSGSSCNMFSVRCQVLNPLSLSWGATQGSSLHFLALAWPIPVLLLCATIISESSHLASVSYWLSSCFSGYFLASFITCLLFIWQSYRSLPLFRHVKPWQHDFSFLNKALSLFAGTASAVPLRMRKTMLFQVQPSKKRFPWAYISEWNNVK